MPPAHERMYISTLSERVSFPTNVIILSQDRRRSRNFSLLGITSFRDLDGMVFRAPNLIP